jgi:hypothetical protein
VDEPQLIKPTRSGAGAYIGLGVGWLLMGAVLLIWLSSTTTGLMWLAVAAVFVVVGLVKASTRVVVSNVGLGLTNAARRRYRWMAWSQVGDVRLDPPGGPRLITVAMLDGHEYTLPLLSEADTSAVLETFRRSR